jgi:membrane protein
MPLAMWARLKKAFLDSRAGNALALLYDSLDRHHGPIAASAMAFDAFLSLVPLAALAGYVLGLFHRSGESLLRPLMRAAPPPVAELVQTAVESLGNGGGVIAPLSVGAFLWATSAGLSTAMYVFENMFWSRPRAWYWRRAIAVLCVFAGIAIVGAVTTLSVAAALASPLLGRIVGFTAPTLTLIGMLSAFFRISIRRDHVFRRRRVLPGVLVTVVLWALLSALFSYYVATLARYATLYGGVAAIAIFLIWLWLLALALLVGGEVNAQLDGVRGTEAGSTPLAPISSLRSSPPEGMTHPRA